MYSHHTCAGPWSILFVVDESVEQAAPKKVKPTMDISKMKVADLREELTKLGLDTRGKKAVLQKRLREAIESEESSST